MLPGFGATENWPPPPDSVPIIVFEEVTWTCSVAPVPELVASTRSWRLSESYSARVIVTASGSGVVGGGFDGAGGVTVRFDVRVTPA